MSLRIGELVGVLRADASGWERGLDRARVRLAGLQRDSAGRLRDMNGRFVQAGSRSGHGFARNLVSSISRGLSTAGDAFTGAMTRSFSQVQSAMASNPYTASIGVALAGGIVSAALPAIGALLSTAVISVGGLAVVGIGYALLKSEPEVKKAAKHLKKTVGDILRDAAAPMKDEFVDAFGALEDLATRTKPYVDRIFAAAAQFIDPLVEGFSNLVENVLPGFTSMMEDAQPTFDGLKEFLSDVGEGLSGFFEQIGESAPDTKVLLEDLGELLKNTLIAAGWVIGKLAKLYHVVHDFVANTISAFQWLYDVLVGHSIIPDLVNAIVGWILSLPGKILGGLSDFISNVVGHFGRMASGARRKVWDVVRVVAGLPGRVWNALGNLGSYLYNSGSSLIQGFINGIWSKIGSVRRAASSLLSAARDYFPFSPAREGPFSGKGWTLYSGASLVEGFQAGIASQLPALRAQLGSMPGLDTPTPGMASAAAAGAAPRWEPARVVLDVTGADEDMKRLIRKMVRVDGRGNTQRAFGRRATSG